MSRADDAEKPPEPEGRIVMDEPSIHIPPPDKPWELWTPVIILAVGFLALLASAIVLVQGMGALGAGVRFVLVVLAFVLVVLVQVPITLAMVYVLAAFLGISFGLLRSALLKLAAINIFFLGFSLVGEVCGHPILAQVALIPICWYLFGSLFDLDIWETLASMFGFVVLGSTLYHIIRPVVAGAAGWFG
jgi:hypothetical protein